MIKTYAYLSVNADGSEQISVNKPKRIEDNIDGVQFNYWFDPYLIELPVGTINKIIDSELTWFDEPYALRQ